MGQGDTRLFQQPLRAILFFDLYYVRGGRGRGI